MKKIAVLVFSTVASLVNAANLQPSIPLDKVVLQISAKQWVTTQTALLTVSVNATLGNADLVKTRTDIMDKLNKITAGEWHILQFDRSQDSSGLEKLYVAAQIRVPQAALTSIYQTAKDVSKPGATYAIDSVEFKPSLDEVQQTKALLRERLYQQVNDEITRLNKVYTTQHYSVNRLYLIDSEIPSQPQPIRSKAMNAMVMSTAAPAITVSNELVMSAMIELASNRLGSASVVNQ